MVPDAQLPAGTEPDEEPSWGAADRPAIVRSEDLFQGRREVWIEHGDRMYRLRVTPSGKLYLTK